MKISVEKRFGRLRVVLHLPSARGPSLLPNGGKGVISLPSRPCPPPSEGV